MNDEKKILLSLLIGLGIMLIILYGTILRNNLMWFIGFVMFAVYILLLMIGDEVKLWINQK